MAMFWFAVCAVAGVSVAYALYKRMPKEGSLLFKIGYMLYTRTSFGYHYYQRELIKAQQKYGNKQHSITRPTECGGARILPIPMSMDNYAYLITDESNTCVLVDPADPQAVQPVLDRENLTPTAVLTTHKHWDHSGGNRKWRERYRNIAVYGGEMDHVPGATHTVKDGDVLQFGQLRFRVLFTAGHTCGHVVYALDGHPYTSPHSLFTGDLLFLAGIGRMFEGSAAAMLNSLDKLLSFPDDTLIWPGHEYAYDNLNFAAFIQPDNQAVKDKQKYVEELRQKNECTSPSTLEEEKTYNPFLRVSDPLLQETLGIESRTDSTQDQIRAETLAVCRKRKDKFKYKL